MLSLKGSKKCHIIRFDSSPPSFQCNAPSSGPKSWELKALWMFNIIQCAIVLICCTKVFKKKGGEEDVFKAGAECICIRLTERSRLLCQCQHCASCLWPGLRGNWPPPYWLTHPHQPRHYHPHQHCQQQSQYLNKKQLHSSVRWVGASVRQGQCWRLKLAKPSLCRKGSCAYFDEQLSLQNLLKSKNHPLPTFWLPLYKHFVCNPNS